MAGLPAQASGHQHTQDFSGVALGPGTWADVSISWTLSPCTPGGDFDGIDGYWYDVSAFAGGSFDLVTSDPLDVDFLTFDAQCELITWNGACFFDLPVPEDPLGIFCSSESGDIESHAVWGFVLNWGGLGTSVLTLS
jgi:hypothetical protein